MASSRLKAMQEAFAAQGNKGGDTRGPSRYYPLGKVEIDQSATFRFVRDKNEDNPMGFLKEIINHNLTINGQEKRVPCLEMYGLKCPVCAAASEFFNSNQNNLGSKLWKKRNYVAQVLVIDDPLKLDVDPSNPVKLLSIGKQVYDILKEATLSGDIENDPDAYEGGHNFIIKKTKGGAKPDGTGFYPTYVVGTRFSPKQTDVPEELRELVEANLIDLNDLVQDQPDIDAYHADLQAALTALTGGRAAAPAPARQAAAPAQAAASNDDDDAPFEGGQTAAASSATAGSTTADLLSRLRNR